MPYKTLLLSVTDTAAVVVAEMLQKYGRHSEDPNNYALVQVGACLSLSAGRGPGVTVDWV